MRTRRDLHKLMNILCAATAAACLFQSELRFELAGHDDAGLSCFTDIRISNSLAEAEVHGLYSYYRRTGFSCPINDYDNRYQLTMMIRLSSPCVKRGELAGVMRESGKVSCFGKARRLYSVCSS